MSTIRSKVGARLGMASATFDVVSSVTEAKETALKTVCTDHGTHAPTPVKQSYGCPICDAKGKITDFEKAREVSKNAFVVVPPEELENLQVSAAIKDQMVFAIYPRDEVYAAVAPHGKPYYLKPTDAVSAEPYALYKHLATLIESGEVLTPDGRPGVIMAIWSAKGAPVFWRLGILNNVLAVQPFCWPNQLDAAPEIPDIDVSKYDAMIPSFVSAISSEFKPEEFRDERADALQAFVMTQTAVEGVTVAGDDTPTSKPIDLMAALAATVASAAPVETPAKKAAPRKRTAKAS